MYEVVKKVNDIAIWRMVGTKGRYIVRLDNNKMVVFSSIKAATEYIEENF